MEIIDKVINRTAPKYTFGFYEVDDIKQESFIICLDAMKNYDNNLQIIFVTTFYFYLENESGLYD